MYQIKAKQNAAYDNVDTESLKPLYGGGDLKDFQIIFRKKSSFLIKSKNIEDALHQIAHFIKIKKSRII